MLDTVSFSQLYYLNREIEMDQRRLRELEAKALPGAQVITGMPHGTGVVDKVGEYAAEIADLRGIIEAKHQQCLYERSRLERYITGMAGIGERWTRNPDGTTHKVPADMTFADWRQQFVQGPLPTGSAGGTISPAQQSFSGAIQGMHSMTQSYQDGLEQRFSTGTPAAQSAFSKYVTSGSVADGAYTRGAHFNASTQKVNMNFADDAVNPRGLGTTFFHEHGHFIDFLSCPGAGYTSMVTSDFGDALRSDYAAYIKAVMKQHGIKKTEAYLVVSQEIQGPLYNAISDLFGGMSANKCVGSYGHWNKRYWKLPGAVEKEAFAHMYEAQFSADKYALMQKYFPTALAEFEKLLNGVI